MPYGPIQLFWLETAGRPFEGAVPLRTLLKCHTAASPFWRETASRRFKAAVALRTLAKWLTATTQVWLETAGRHPHTAALPDSPSHLFDRGRPSS